MTRPYEYRPAWFFVLAFVGSWGPWLLGLYLGSEPGLGRYAALLNFMGLLGPRRIRPLLAVLAVAMPLLVILLSIAISLWFGESTAQFGLAGGRDLVPLIILALILAPIYEETGWHGYGVDSLRARNGVME